MSSIDDLLGYSAGEKPKPSTMSEELIRKIKQLNPQMADQDSTAEFMVSAQKIVQEKTPQAQDNSTHQVKVKDADHLFEMTRDDYEQEQRQLEVQLAIINQKLTSLKSKHLNAIIQKLIVIDPNLSSMVTQLAIKNYKEFLNHIGFSVEFFVQELRNSRK